MRKVTTFIASAAIAVGAYSIATPAFAADDIDSNPITEFFAGFGLSKKEKPDIDYNERAPLVPPTSVSTLPPPVEKGATGRDTGQWPKDPDEERRALKRAEADRLPTETDNYRNETNSRLSPSELGGKRTRGANVVTGPGQGASGDRHGYRLEPADLKGHRQASTTPAPEPGVEPERKRLSDPPSGYLTGDGVTATTAPEKKGWLGNLFSPN